MQRPVDADQIVGMCSQTPEQLSPEWTQHEPAFISLRDDLSSVIDKARFYRSEAPLETIDFWHVTGLLL
jgi:hypothetical protein